MQLLNKQQILDAEDFKTEIVDVPEWGGSVMVMTMTSEARDALEASFVDFDDDKSKAKENSQARLANIRAKYVAASVVDEKGNLIFSQKDIIALGKKSAAAMDRVFAVTQKLNKVDDKDIEDLAKNS